MNKFSHEKKTHYTNKQLFDLVNDIEKYPEFLPWCNECVILSKDNNKIIARMSIKKGFVTQRFTTENIILTNESITINLIEGPFKILSGKWHFISNDSAGGSVIRLDLKYEFSSTLFQLTLGPIFKIVSNTIINSFVSRAMQLYD